ncbi:MAG: hypothetical protein L3K26_20295 [Candidatus Hydrogenedentes bacterium]|nr:hypothetical protein [Candidatus Hydrogenedentota bacterium]
MKIQILLLILHCFLGLGAYAGEEVNNVVTAFHIPLGQRQLFWDDYGIARIENLKRTLHQPEKKGAVIEPDQSWEYSLQTRCAPVWDPNVERFKLWMITSTTIPGVAGTTYAESADGIHWTKPVLRQKAIQGSLENNIVTVDPKREWPANAIENVVFDPDDLDPSRRFKGFAHVYTREPMVSPDGIHWKLLDVPALPSADESNLTYDRLTGIFIATLKTNGPYGRAHAIWTSTDFEHWTDTGVVFHADEEDQILGRVHMEGRLADPALHHPPDIDPEDCTVDVYNIGVSRYEGLYLGFPAMFHHTGTMGFHLVQLACSRDLKTWDRLGNRETFIGPSTVASGAYDLTQILPPTGPVIRGDELWFYYTGIKYRKPPEGAKKVGAICRAVLRRDGFISLDGGDQAGMLLTQPFTLAGKKLFVNVDAEEGELRAEVLDKDGTVLAMSALLKGDQLRGALRWAQGDLAELTGTLIRLRFTLRNAAFYAYWLGGE